MKKINKIRVNITVDSELLERAKKKLHLFGGKLSTLFNAYLSDFVDTMNKDYAENQKELVNKIIDLELRMKKMEEKSS